MCYVCYVSCVMSTFCVFFVRFFGCVACVFLVFFAFSFFSLFPFWVILGGIWHGLGTGGLVVLFLAFSVVHDGWTFGLSWSLDQKNRR